MTNLSNEKKIHLRGRKIRRNSEFNLTSLAFAISWEKRFPTLLMDGGIKDLNPLSEYIMQGVILTRKLTVEKLIPSTLFAFTYILLLFLSFEISFKERNRFIENER